MADKIKTEFLHDNRIIRITLNAPKANVVDAGMMGDLQKSLDDLQNQPEVKLLQFIGAGDHFSFGASVPEHVRDKAPGMLKQFHELFYSLADLAVPTAALVSGQCLGGGMELALMCNYIFADKSAKLGQPEINLGVFAPPASVILPMKIGQARADCLLTTGRIMPAEEAEQMGLLTRLFENREAMLEGVDDWAQKHILPKSASSLKYAVRAARWRFNEALRDRLKKLEQFYTDELMATDDANEGIQSFLERRQPEWRNR